MTSGIPEWLRDLDLPPLTEEKRERLNRLHVRAYCDTDSMVYTAVTGEPVPPCPWPDCVVDGVCRGRG